MPTLITTSAIPDTVTAIDVPVTVEELDSLAPATRRLAELQKFEAKPGQSLVVASAEGPMEILVGLGPASSVGTAEIRKAAAAYVRVVKNHREVATTLATALGDDRVAEAAGAAADAVAHVAYRYSQYDQSRTIDLEAVHIVADGDHEAAIDSARIIAKGVATARDLTNEPGGSMTPEKFAAQAVAIGAEAGFEVEVWDEQQIKAEALGGLLAVNQGSVNPPRLVIMRLKPSGQPTAKIALVGKGITFDSGGLSLKTAAGMATMKVDMAGGAAVLGTLQVLAGLSTSVEVTGYVPLTDNMTGGNAQRPGDVFTARNSTTVEVLNTDAEGRLILADGLALAAEGEPDAIIDIATLTGAASVALGVDYAAMMSNDNEVAARLEAASARTGDKIWRMPLAPEYRPQLDSSIANLKNIGAGPYGGSITAALFLQEFVADTPWAHIDLGMAALSEKDDGLATEGATGFGVRLMADAILNWDQ